MIFVIVGFGLILLWAIMMTYGEHKFLKGYEVGLSRGYDVTIDEVGQYLPWNAPSQYLLEWARARQIEELVSYETEEFLKTI